MSFEFSSYQSIRYMVYATIVDAFSLKVSARLSLQVAPSLVLYALLLWVKTFGRLLGLFIKVATDHVMTWSDCCVLRVQCDIVSIIMKFMVRMIRRIFICSGILTAACLIGGGLPQRRSGQSSHLFFAVGNGWHACDVQR